jgi:hypothetical protein
MNDGRFISNYIRSSTFDQYIRTVNNINTAAEFRNYLQNNGDDIINNLKSYIRENNTCGVNGKCLPMSGPNSNLNIKDFDNNMKMWYEELLDEPQPQLDFMMSSNKNKQFLQQEQENENKKCNMCKN